MKDLKERAKEYADFQWAGHTEDMIQDVKNSENDFYAGAKTAIEQVRELVSKASREMYTPALRRQAIEITDLEKILSEIENG